ncbi:hypothetical protein [Flammeovirga aprica]|uniref:Uncharacterized protein n=1 Tax=Flammeovirga aprica JL-4 TaxID=694437 RepID=A0A7X9RZ48_9BACT|nr:hypothetical protein [Flammeovirga aprica]NME71378.1 hypothetical protein [Flammeovirga aprica JL-4]
MKQTDNQTSVSRSYPGDDLFTNYFYGKTFNHDEHNIMISIEINNESIQLHNGNHFINDFLLNNICRDVEYNIDTLVQNINNWIHTQITNDLEYVGAYDLCDFVN